MSISPVPGQPAPREVLINIPRLVSDFYIEHPDLKNPADEVSFGTSGHRGTSQECSYNEDHILAIAQAICDYRKQNEIIGPMYIGKDTHALSIPAELTAIEVFAANEIEIRIGASNSYTPTPVISHAILTYNNKRKSGWADGVIITPSHNPPQDGGFKYNPPSGGPAGPEVTNIIQNQANQILRGGLKAVKRMPITKALNADTTQQYDYILPYVRDLINVVDLEEISKKRLRIGVDPMGGASINYWDVIAEIYNLNITIVNRVIDPSFPFMRVDYDGKIRMDCSSPYAMASLIEMRDRFDISFGNDPDADRHGVVTSSSGLMNPNHYLAVAVWYLVQNRPDWSKDLKIGKTIVSSSMIDRVVFALDRKLAEVPVGFKWFVEGLLIGSYGFGGEESAGAAFLRKNGTVWTTDKDGILLNLLAAEITARTGRDPGEHYDDLSLRFGSPVYKRVDAKATSSQKAILKALAPDDVKVNFLAGEKIIDKLTHAPLNNAPIGGLKIVTENGWFAARPSGTEEVYKIYAESFIGESHLNQIINDAQNMIDSLFKSDAL
jgi:phosphoglucomutase